MLSRYLAAARTVCPVAAVPGRRFYAAQPKPIVVKHPDNEVLVRGLQECREQEDLTKTSRLGLAKGINIVAACPEPIRTLSDVSNLVRLAPTVRLHLCTLVQKAYGEAPESSNDVSYTLLKQKADNHAAYLKDLMSIRGLGKLKAGRLIQAGCNSTEKLVANPKFMDMLPVAQRLAAQYHFQTALPVTRELTEDMQAFMRDSLSLQWEIIPVGEYRRGASEYTELKFLFLNPGYRHVEVPTMPKRVRDGSLSKIVGKATNTPRGTADETTVDDLEESLGRRRLLVGRYKFVPSLWRGIVRIPKREGDGDWESYSSREAGLANQQGVFRDAEFIIIAAKSKGAALLKHTGDDKFFQYLRTRADERGLFLNEDGLWRFHEQEPLPNVNSIAAVPPKQTSASRNPEDFLHGYWELLPSETEEQILEELDVAWIEPERRNFQFLKW